MKLIIAAWIIGSVLVMVPFALRGLRVSREERREKERLAEGGCAHLWWRPKWSQDGWVRQCKLCGDVQYGGDDYDGGPKWR